ncbi:MAG TPA: FHA domain-containing protein [Polyangiaceae bacterium]|jgi:pSer/pThr/pTyr-binding forkhead associated (FHA) protein
MKPLSEYRQRAAAAEIARLDVPVLLVGMRGPPGSAAAEYRTSTREGTPSMPTVTEALHDDGVSLAPLSKSARNPYRNFIFVGRSSTCDVILRDASVSKTHAVFERDDRASLWMLRDNRSHNGTWVNRARLGPEARVSVASGDSIVFGAYPAYLLSPDELRRILGAMSPVDG